MDFLTGIENLLDMPAAEKVEVMRELTAHYDDLCREMVASGVSDSQARQGAAQRLGAPAEIAARLNAAHNTASWKSAVLCVVPFAASAMYLAAAALHLASGVRYAVLIAIGVVMLATSARELLRGRRPIWLATWLAAGLMCIPGLLYPLGSPPSLMAGMRAAAFAVLLLAMLVLILGLATRRLLTTVVIACALAALSAACLLLTMSWVPVVIMALCAVVLLVLVARLIFQAHPYGTRIEAPLFLLAVFALRFAHPAPASDASFQALATGLCGLAVVWFTRAPSRLTKAVVCFCAFFVYAFVETWCLPIITYSEQTPLYLYGLSPFLSMAFIVGSGYLVMVTPMLREGAEPNRLTIAR